MSNNLFSVSIAPRVNIRCQFVNLPGVTHITLEYDPRSQENPITGKIDSAYGDFLMDHQAILCCVQRLQAGSLYIFKKSVFQEIAQAVESGMETLNNMIEAANKKEVL
ncbi:hypothetical protein muut_156 [Escherichia phage muut]|uniref:DUF7247 domain-containing protein n=1 Tax=Escherichia phage muut TaxID=2696426 RepID=A0A6B9WJU2_9CAUD|nr:hypothetical protein JR322_gp092 [Escherichia phage muut]QHR65953.1 hypothetical protein muut_156 [Escherichia phage muut]